MTSPAAMLIAALLVGQQPTPQARTSHPETLELMDCRLQAPHDLREGVPGRQGDPPLLPPTMQPRQGGLDRRAGA